MRLLHLVSLKQIGGIQRDYSHFINTPVSGRSDEHHTLLSRPGIADPIRADILAGSASVTYLTHVGKLKIPAWLGAWRQARLNAIVARVKPDAIVLWSTPRGLRGYRVPPSTALVYYEHGAVWFNRAANAIGDELERFDGFVCNSRASSRMIALRWGVSDQQRVAVCPNAVQLGDAAAASARQLCRDQPFTIGVAGRLEPLKGFALAIHAIKGLVDNGRDVVLQVAGVGSELDALKALTQTLGLTERVTFLELVSDMAGFYRGIDLFVCPSIREPFGLVAAEAMAYGLPVVCTAVDGLPEVVDDGVSGLCLSPALPVSDYPGLGGRLEGIPNAVYDPAADRVAAPRLLDPGAMAAEIQTLIDTPGRYEALSAGALAHAKARIAYGDHAREVIDAIEAFAQRRRASA